MIIPKHLRDSLDARLPEQPRPEQASATAYCMDCKREATPLCVAHHDTRTRAVGAAPERGDQPKLIDQLLDAAIYAEDIDRRVAARVQIAKLFEQHSTLIAQRERLLKAAQFLLAMNATNYDRDAMRSEGGFEALQKAVDEAVRLDQIVSRTTTGREG